MAGSSKDFLPPDVRVAMGTALAKITAGRELQSRIGGVALNEKACLARAERAEQALGEAEVKGDPAAIATAEAELAAAREALAKARRQAAASPAVLRSVGEEAVAAVTALLAIYSPFAAPLIAEAEERARLAQREFISAVLLASALKVDERPPFLALKDPFTGAAVDDRPTPEDAAVIATVLPLARLDGDAQRLAWASINASPLSLLDRGAPLPRSVLA